MLPQKYKPTLSDLVKFDFVPDSLSFITDPLTQILGKFYYDNYRSHKSLDRSSASFYLDVYYYKELQLFEIPGTGLAVVINPPDPTDPFTGAKFDITFFYKWQLLKYINNPGLNSFDFSFKSFLLVSSEVLGFDYNDLLNQAILGFHLNDSDPLNSPLDLFVANYNSLYPNPINTYTSVEDVVSQIRLNEDLVEVIIDNYISSFEDLANLLKSTFGAISAKQVRNILIPELAFSINNVSVGIQLPRSIFIPLDPMGNEIDPPAQSHVVFNAGAIHFSTNDGIIFDKDPSFDFQKSAIMNTGFTIEVNQLKLDLSESTNIIEADLDGRPADFRGVYIHDATIGLPAKWFDNNDNHPGTTAKLSVYDMLVGTGGVSGTIALETIVLPTGTIADFYSDCFSFQYPIEVTSSGNTVSIPTYGELLIHLNSLGGATYNFEFPLNVVPIGGTAQTINNQTQFNTFIATCNTELTPRLVKKIGGNGFEIWFNSFDITFKQSAVVESNIVGGLKIPRLKDGNGDIANIDIKGHFDADGDFSVTASEKDGFQPIELPGVLKLHINSLEVGKEEDKFYLGTACDIEFTNSVIQSLIGDQRIKISRLRIWSDGSFEIIGGAIPIPASFSLNLGPVKIGITGINYGSYQQEHEDHLRKYNYFGFDGAISLNPLGIDGRGEGIKYYFTVDDKTDVPTNDPEYRGHHSYIRIQTIEVDITIPGSASAATATAIIKGFLSIKEDEFAGGISLKIPKAGISGSAKMRLQPKHPAFIVDANIELPKPIPLGSTGLGVFAFRGILGYRFVAEKEAVGLVSGEDTWYDYYKYPPRGINIEKFSGPNESTNYENPFSLGAGASFATYGSDSILSLRVFVLLSIPSLFMIEGKASVLSKRYGLDDSGEPPFFAFLAIGDNSIEAGLGADFDLPQNNGWIVDLYAEVQAGFFFNNPSAWYINFGTKQQPISAKVLTLVTMQTYLMLSARGIEAGAKAEFEFDKRYGPVRVRAYAYLEVGGFISFERPQIGAYFAVGGEALVDVFIASLYIGLDLLLGAEAPKPFLIYGKFRLCVKIKICWFIKIKFCGNVELKWEKNREVDRTPIPPVLAEQTDEFVKALHMLNGEVFELLQLTSSITNGAYVPPNDDPRLDDVIIPMDSYVDIKFGKGVLPAKVADIIGGVNNPPEGYSDLIPPQKVVRGKEVRQVTHHYSVEEITIKAWNGSSWVDYHPYNALETSTDLSHLKIGHFQKSGKEYNAIRLLASDPFSYTNQGEPGWFIPEQLGITPASLFCEGLLRPLVCSDWMNKSVGAYYYAEATFFSHLVAYQLNGYTWYDENNILHGDRAEVVNENNPFGFLKSLKFDNSNELSILLPQASTRVDIKLTSIAIVFIDYYRTVVNDLAIEQEYQLIMTLTKTPADLESVVEYNNPADPVSKIVIRPKLSNRDAINAIKEQIELLFVETYENAIANGQSTANIKVPDNVDLYNQLLIKLAKLKSVGCVEVIDRPTIHCQIYNEIDNDGIDEYRFRIYDHECDILLSASTRYYTIEAAVIEMNTAVYEVRHNYPDSILYKQTSSGKWYFNVIDPTGEVIARRIQYFTTFELCEAAVLELKDILDDNDISVSEEPCTPGQGMPVSGEQSEYFINSYTESDMITARQFGSDFYIGGNKFISNGRVKEATGNLIRLDTYGDPLYSTIYRRAVKTKHTHFRPEKMVKLSDGTLAFAGVLNGVLTLSRINVEGDILWSRQFNVYGPLKYEYQLINSEKNTLILAYINKEVKGAEAKGPNYKHLQLLRFNYGGDIMESKRMNTYTETRTVYLLAMISDKKLGVILTLHNYNYSDRLIMGFDSALDNSWVKKHPGSLSFYDLSLSGNRTLYILARKIKPGSYYLFRLDLKGLVTAVKTNFEMLRWKLDRAAEPYFAQDHFESYLGEQLAVYDRNRLYVFDRPKLFSSTKMVAVKSFSTPKGNTYQINDAAYDKVTNSFTLLLNNNVIAHLDNTLDSCITKMEEVYPLLEEKYLIIAYELKSGTFIQNLIFTVPVYQKIIDELRVGIICEWEVPPPVHEECHTLLHEVCWLSVEDYIYNENIPGQDAIQEDYDAGIQAITEEIAPIWRPNTKYYLHFKLKDNVDNGGDQQEYDYHYGFKTAGPVGHFHLDPGSTYGDIIDEDGNPVEESVVSPDRYLLTSLRGYIDYKRSYPNADGNLLNAKPLFYGDSEILLFFIHPFTFHLLSGWPAYNGMPALEGSMKIVLKDPVEDITLENPPPPDVITTEIPQAVEEWTEDTAPLMPEYLQIWSNYVEEQLNNPDLNCLIVGGEPIRPASVNLEITMNYLKPLKLYTALVNNTFEEVTRQVHSFVFQTSRYFNFEEQVNSYELSDDDGNTRDAIFEIKVELTPTGVDDVYDTIFDSIDGNNSNNSTVNGLESQFLHLFDRATEGLLGVQPFDPPVTTEFNVVRNVNPGLGINKVIAIWIRNPEPFNDPKIPLHHIRPTVKILDWADNTYLSLYSKDYSQILIMPNSKEITENDLDFRFEYLKWNGLDYDVANTVDALSIIIQ